MNAKNRTWNWPWILLGTGVGFAVCAMGSVQSLSFLSRTVVPNCDPTVIETTDSAPVGSAFGLIAYLAIFSAIVLPLIALYVLPAWLAYKRNKRDKQAILALNLGLGWTTLAWVGCLVWALKLDPPASPPPLPSGPSLPSAQSLRSGNE